MLTAKLSVQYEDDWTSSLINYDVSGEFLASTFRDRRYFGLLALEVAESDYDAIIEIIRKHDSTESINVAEKYSTGGVDRLSATLLIRSALRVYAASGTSPRRIHSARWLWRDTQWS